MQEMQRAETPATTLFELLPLIDSSDMNSDDWIRIASLIEALYHDFDAFVVIMGTDTMAYAASALSFILEDLGKMVVLTGSMLPLSDLFNDAQRNLVVSVVMAATLDVPEVCVFMDDQLLRGNRTVKSNSGGLDAFESPNYPSIAKLETGIRFRRNAALALPKGRFRVHKSLVTNIAVWRMIPGFDDEYIFNSIQHSNSLRAIVLELYGTGNLSSRKQSLLEALAAAMEKGIVIVATSQCLRGSVDLKAYALGRNLEAIGVVSGLDMTTEAVVTKLAYLLSWPDANPALIALYMSKNLRGEVTESQQKGPVFNQSSGTNENSNGEVFITTASISKAVQRSRSGKLLEFPTTPISAGHASGVKLRSVPGTQTALTSPSLPSTLPSSLFSSSSSLSSSSSIAELREAIPSISNSADEAVLGPSPPLPPPPPSISIPSPPLPPSLVLGERSSLNEDQVEISNAKALIITTEVQNSNEKVTNSEADSTSVKDISPQRVSNNIPMPVSITLDQQTIDVSAQQLDGLSTTTTTTTIMGESKGKGVQLDLDDAADVILYTIKAHLLEQQQSPSR